MFSSLIRGPKSDQGAESQPQLGGDEYGIPFFQN